MNPLLTHVCLVVMDQCESHHSLTIIMQDRGPPKIYIRSRLVQVYVASRPSTVAECVNLPEESFAVVLRFALRRNPRMPERYYNRHVNERHERKAKENQLDKHVEDVAIKTGTFAFRRRRW